MKTENVKPIPLNLLEENLLIQLSFKEATTRLDPDAEKSNELQRRLFSLTDEFSLSPNIIINTLKLVTIKILHEKYKRLPVKELKRILNDVESKKSSNTSSKYGMRVQGKAGKSKIHNAAAK